MSVAGREVHQGQRVQVGVQMGEGLGTAEWACFWLDFAVREHIGGGWGAGWLEKTFI